MVLRLLCGESLVLPLAVTAGKTDPDDIPETPKNPVTRTGNLWVLGKHRIV